MSAHSPFLERLRRGPILCDGGMGTELYARRISYERCFEQLNLTEPELIKTIHLDYAAAGAEIIETNTFGANRYRLAEYSIGLIAILRNLNHGLDGMGRNLGTSSAFYIGCAATPSAPDVNPGLEQE